jgi:hypothetical protein
MEHSPSWEANRFAGSQEIPHILWNLKVHYHIHKCLLPVSILSHLNPVHTPTSYFLKINLNIILSSRPGSPQWSPPLRCPHQNPVHASTLSYLSYMPRPPQYSHCYPQHNSGWAVQIMKLQSVFPAQSVTVRYFKGCCQIQNKWWHHDAAWPLPIPTQSKLWTSCIGSWWISLHAAMTYHHVIYSYLDQ